MTKLTRLLALAGTAALAATGPARAADVALFANVTYVDYAPGVATAEASNVHDTLSAQGHAVHTFTGFTDADFRAALADRDVLVIPEQENSALSLSAAAETVIQDFVDDGGILVVFGTAFGRAGLALINGIFNYSPAVSAGSGSASFTLNTTGAAGTQFAGGPQSLPSNNLTVTVSSSSLPSGSRVIYRSGGAAAVAMMPSRPGQFAPDAGAVIFVGWDWYQAVPNGSQDNGWLSVLNSAVNEGRDPTKADVALLADGSVVSFAYNSATARASNVLASAQSRGNKVLPFTGITDADFTAALAGREVLAIPSQSVAALYPLLSASAETVILDFVHGGGILVVFGEGSQNRDLGLMNGLFGFSPLLARSAFVSPGYVLDASAAAGTPFEGGPYRILTLPFPHTPTVARSTLPPGSRPVYFNGSPIPVAVIPVGCGSLVFIGADWDNVEPIGTTDNGWPEVLDRALSLRGRAFAANDFDGDGWGDILWRNRSNGNVFVWLTHGFPVPGAARRQLAVKVPLPWRMAGTGDFNRDCKADVLWHNPNTGFPRLWLMDGFTITAGNVVKPQPFPTNWTAESIQDYNDDGAADILWRDTNASSTTVGSAFVWFMDGFAKVGSLPVGNVPTAISVEE